MAGSVATFNARIRWRGATHRGWERYDRTHTATASPAEQEIQLTTHEAKGDPRILNPEQLVVMATSSCQMLWFLHLAAKARLDVVEYSDDAVAIMPEGQGFTEIVLRPRIVLATGAQDQQVPRLVRLAHQRCNVAQSLRAPVSVEPRVEVRS